MTDPIWVRPNVAAYAAGVQVKTLQAWVRRGHITPTNSNGNYDLIAIYAYQQQGTDARMSRAIAARKRRGETRRKADVAHESAAL